MIFDIYDNRGKKIENGTTTIITVFNITTERIADKKKSSGSRTRKEQKRRKQSWNNKNVTANKSNKAATQTLLETPPTQHYAALHFDLKTPPPSLLPLIILPYIHTNSFPLSPLITTTTLTHLSPIPCHSVLPSRAFPYQNTGFSVVARPRNIPILMITNPTILSSPQTVPQQHERQWKQQQDE